MRCINLPTGRSYSPSRVEKIIIERECYCCGLESVKNCRIRKLTPPPPNHPSSFFAVGKDIRFIARFVFGISCVFIVCVLQLSLLQFQGQLWFYPWSKREWKRDVSLCLPRVKTTLLEFFPGKTSTFLHVRFSPLCSARGFLLWNAARHLLRFWKWEDGCKKRFKRKS